MTYVTDVTAVHLTVHVTPLFFSYLFIQFLITHFSLEQCLDPGNPLNGWRFGVNYTQGGVVTFKCKQGPFDLIGPSNITCDEGEWSHPRPSCEGKYVKVPNL